VAEPVCDTPRVLLDPEAIVQEHLRALVEGLRQRNLEGVLSLFDERAVLFGSEAGERAIGRAELASFFGRLFAEPRTVGWEWNSLHVGSAGDVSWFVGPAMVVVRTEDGAEQRLPYRLSGVLCRDLDGRWRFAQFNGAEPAGAA
jgi:ketosteroid isomerase-like protein